MLMKRPNIWNVLAMFFSDSEKPVLMHSKSTRFGNEYSKDKIKSVQNILLK